MQITSPLLHSLGSRTHSLAASEDRLAMGKKKMDEVAEVYESVTDGLKSLYRSKIRPVEEVCERCLPKRASRTNLHARRL